MRAQRFFHSDCHFEFDEAISSREVDGKVLLDYWGYNTVGFFAPNTNYIADNNPGREGTELKLLIKALHANGIEVIHAADSLKAAKAQKRARREAAKAQRIRKVEKMILTYGWDHLEDIWKRRAEKLLDDDQIYALVQQRETSRAKGPPEEAQISLF